MIECLRLKNILYIQMYHINNLVLYRVLNKYILIFINEFTAIEIEKMFFNNNYKL